MATIEASDVPDRPEHDDGDGDDASEPERSAPGDGDVERREARVAERLHGERLDRLLVEIAGEFSRRHLQGLIQGGQVRVDGRVVLAPSKKVHAGQAVALELVPTAESRAFRPEALPISVVFEDEHLLVVDKAAAMVVHPAAGNWSGTLLNALLARNPGAAALPRAGIVHRLDKDTSGLMVVGKTLPAVTALVRAIAAHEVRREYLAIAHGCVMPTSFSVEAPIGRDPRARVRMAVVGSGKPARTDVEVIARHSATSALRCRLHTGRTHQIRVHLASRGHPLLADAVYGGRPALGMARQALHALRLGFRHPVSGAALAFEAPPPDDFAAAWQEVTSAGVDRDGLSDAEAPGQRRGSATI